MAEVLEAASSGQRFLLLHQLLEETGTFPSPPFRSQDSAIDSLAGHGFRSSETRHQASVVDLELITVNKTLCSYIKKTGGNQKVKPIQKFPKPAVSLLATRGRLLWLYRSLTDYNSTSLLIYEHRKCLTR